VPLHGASTAHPLPPTFRAQLTLAVLSLVAALTTALMLSQAYSTQAVLQRTVRAVLQAYAAQDEALLSSYFGAAPVCLFAAAQWAQGGLLTTADVKSTSRLLMPVSDSTPQISAAYLRDDAGSLTLVRMPGGWQSIQIAATHPEVAQFALWPEPHSEPGKRWTGIPPANLRQRSWYATVQTPGEEIAWSALLPEGPAGPGIMAAMHLRTPGFKPLLLAFEITLADLEQRIDVLRPTPHGFSVLMDSTGRLIEADTLPADQSPVAKSTRIGQSISRAELEQQLSRQLRDKLPRASFDAALPAEPAIMQLELGGRRWWAGTTSLLLRAPVWVQGAGTRELRGAPHLRFITLVPESDLIGALQTQRTWAVVIAGLITLMALFLGGQIARLLSAPLAALVVETERIQRLELDDTPQRPLAAVREIAQLNAAHDSLRRALQNFSRYVPIRLVRELVDRGELAQIGGRTALLTILITDIRDFVTLSEELPPAELTAQLEEYFECLLEVLNEGGATVDKLVGDSVISFWGAPSDDERQAEHSVDTALKLIAAAEALNAKWKAQGRRVFRTKAGIAQGNVVVGNVGASWRLNYTALGDAVNLASRLQQLNTRYGSCILVNDMAQASCRDAFEWRLMDRTEIRGRRTAEDIYEPLGRRGAVSRKRMDYARGYEELLALLWDGKLDAVRAQAAKLRQQDSRDAAVQTVTARLMGRLGD
jgi:class 3 adenylate cyclase